MVSNLVSMINSFSCHSRRQAEIKALFAACCYLQAPPNVVRRLKLRKVSVVGDKVCITWSASRVATTISSIDRGLPGGEELFVHASDRLRSSKGRDFFLFLKASKNKNWFGSCCRRYLGLKVSFFKGCSKVPVVVLPNKKYF